MSAGDQINLAFSLLDHQLLDCDERRCGKVDDVELSGGVDEAPRVTALLVGPDAWRRRRPRLLGQIAARIGGGGLVRVPWDDVCEIGSAIKLRHSARELGLGAGDDEMRPFVSWLPGS